MIIHVLIMDQRVQIVDDNLDRIGTDCWGQYVQYDLKIDWDNVFWFVTDCRRQCVQYDLQIDWDIIHSITGSWEQLGSHSKVLFKWKDISDFPIDNLQAMMHFFTDEINIRFISDTIMSSFKNIKMMFSFINSTLSNQSWFFKSEVYNTYITIISWN